MTGRHIPSDKDVGRVLFFGRKDCAGTQKALALMQQIGFDINYIESKRLGEPLPEDIQYWRGDYLFCYRSYFIIPKHVINNARIAAINFHPASPDYPGSGCLNFALYEGAKEYGVTAHLMNEKVDNGPILETIRFPILDSDDVQSLLERTHDTMRVLFNTVISGIATGGTDYIRDRLTVAANETWRGDARRMNELTRLQNVPADVSRRELNRRIRAAHTRNFPVFTMLHGRKFILDRGDDKGDRRGT